MSLEQFPLLDQQAEHKFQEQGMRWGAFDYLGPAQESTGDHHILLITSSYNNSIKIYLSVSMSGHWE